MRAVVVISLFTLLAGSACTRPVCVVREATFEPTLVEAWAAKKDLYPPNATVCGHFTRDGKVRADSVVVDFEDDDNPMVRIVEHLEAKGWSRTRQDFTNPELLNAQFSEPGSTSDALRVVVERLKGRSFATYSRP